MLNYKQWKLITESFGPTNLGLKSYPVVGGVVGAQFEEGLHDEDEDEEEEGGEEEEAGDDEGDSEEDQPNPDFIDNPQGPEKSFPPDDSEEMDGLPTPDEEMLGGEEGSPFGDDGMGGDPAAMGHDDFAAALSKHLGGPAKPQAPVGQDADMSFLNDIDMDMLGPDFEGGEEMGGAPDLGADLGADLGGDEPAPEEMGDEDLGGEGDYEFDLDDEGDEEMGDDIENMRFMSKCCGPKFMSKGGKCENVSLTESLAAMAQGPSRKRQSSGLSEDTLFRAVDPSYDPEAKAGNVGFAPQGRVGGVGGGYTQDDIKGIPVLGENRKFPTLAEYIAKRDAAKKG